MTTFLKPFRRLFTPRYSIPAGIYHYQAPPDDPRNYRLHLRLEPDGGGVLIVNAATVLHLNQTAAEYAYYLVHNTEASRVARQMAARYRVSKQQASQDYINLSGRIQALVETPDLDPVTFLDFERQAPFSGRITAPYRLDCALTYRLRQEVSPDAAPIERVARELSADEWKRILDKAWAAGIPHVVFTGGEPTLRDDLPELIAHAEALGQVSGLISDGLRVADDDYRRVLLQTGLDHLMIVLRPESETAWEAVGESMEDDLFLAVHLTITEQNREQIPAWLQRLASLGVHEISISASAPFLADDLQAARDRAAALQLDLVWNLPTPYSDLHPVALETSGVETPEGAGRAWLYVEPDGDVRPAQGLDPLLGNLLDDPWEKIWQS
ncbi:MAG: radical SAM protein [Anaerolineales bacterium]|nr:radical SAM protein [Anaerolineales bacterium]